MSPDSVLTPLISALAPNMTSRLSDFHQARSFRVDREVQ